MLGYKQRRNPLWYLLWISLLFDLGVMFYIIPNGYNRFWTSNLYMFIEICIVAYYVTRSLPVQSRKILQALTALVIAGYTIHTFINNVLIFNGTGASVICVWGVCICIFGLYNMLRQQKVMHLETSEYFWANVSYIIFFAGNFMLFLFVPYLEKTHRESLSFLWPLIHNNLNILHNLLLAIALTRKAPGILPHPKS